MEVSSVAGGSTSFALTGAADQRWMAIEAVARRSYCAQVMPRRDAVDRATPTLSALRADGATLLGGGTPGAVRACFVAPASETVLFKVTQTDVGERRYRLTSVETTQWANWFFIGGDYSSFTLLRNVTDATLYVTLTWRGANGIVAGTESVAIGAGGVYHRDARAAASAAIAGSVEVAYTGEPQALVGSQTTLSATTGLSFDTIFMQRHPW